MALQDILKRILDQAQKEVERIQEQAEAEKKERALQSKAREQEELEKLHEKTEKITASIEQKMCSMARRENAQVLLRTKQDLIRTALERFLGMLEDADDKLYGQVLAKLFEVVSATSGKVLAPPKRIEITTKHAPPGFDVVAHKDIEGGFVLKVGNAEIDNSFRSLIFSEYKDQLTSYFAEQLKLV
ncbi:V-type ATP synthase subunit E [Candidatus Gracilibacteria bacterium]|nr:V-type ATP synthase subunit E [Candidatus Gracilibacteria bacterium]